MSTVVCYSWNNKKVLFTDFEIFNDNLKRLSLKISKSVQCNFQKGRWWWHSLHLGRGLEVYEIPTRRPGHTKAKNKKCKHGTTQKREIGFVSRGLKTAQGSKAEHGTMLIYREQKYIIRSSMEYCSLHPINYTWKKALAKKWELTKANEVEPLLNWNTNMCDPEEFSIRKFSR